MSFSSIPACWIASMLQGPAPLRAINKGIATIAACVQELNRFVVCRAAGRSPRNRGQGKLREFLMNATSNAALEPGACDSKRPKGHRSVET